MTTPSASTAPTATPTASTAAGRPAPFPFTAVVGQPEAKLALLLAAIDPRIGGVLLRGDKGSAKTTVVRALAAVDDRPFVDLPLAATEERVVGSIDLRAALGGDGIEVQTGLLAEAHGGVLYVDEVNLLADHLVDVLLDVAASGTNRIERDGISHQHPARFVLVGSMNPEEGDLRPQLLDRFGLAVDVQAPLDPHERAEAVARRLDFDADPTAFEARWHDEQADLRRRLQAARPAPLTAEVLVAASRLAVEAGAEGLRADLVLARAAAALAGWEGRATVEVDDLRRVGPLVLAHRARRQPTDPPGAADQRLDEAIDRALAPDEDPPTGDDPTPDEPSSPDHGSEDHGSEDRSGHDGPQPDSDPADGNPSDAGHAGDDAAPPASGPDERTRPAEPDLAGAVAHLAAQRRVQPHAGAGRRSPVSVPDRGRLVGTQAPSGPLTSVALPATVAAAASRWAADPAVAGRFEAEDLRVPVREARTGNLLVVAVDASASMDAEARMGAVKGALLGVLVDAYQRRDRVALVTFGGRGAEVALRPTGSVEVARARLDSLATGGDTPLGDGIRAAAQLAAVAASPTLQPLVVLVTDGRATAGSDPVGDALAAAAEVARRKVPAVVIDVEPPGPGRLGLAAEVAEAMGARHLLLSELQADALERTLRSL